jgi:hypothetical protein
MAKVTVALGSKTPVSTVCRVFGSYVECTAKWGRTSLSAGAVITSGLQAEREAVWLRQGACVWRVYAFEASFRADLCADAKLTH